MDKDKSDDEAVMKQTKRPAVDKPDANFEPIASERKLATSQKKKKSSNGKPTRPLSAYNLFYRHERTRWLEAMKTDPNKQKIPPKERFLAMGRHISRRWNELTEHEKQKYKQEAVPYYAEFLEEKKRYEAKKSKEAVAERKILEEAAQREVSKMKESHRAQPAASSRLNGQYELFNQSFIAGSREDTGTHPFVMPSPHQQGTDAMCALLGVQSRSAEPFLSASLLTGLDLSHISHAQQHHARHPSSPDAILEILHREHQRILMNRLLTNSHQQAQQLGYAATASTEELQRLLELTRSIEGNHSRDGTVGTFLDLLKRGNASGF